MSHLQQNLYERNVHLLLRLYGYTPEHYIDRYHIHSGLQDIFNIFDGKAMPNKTNQNRIAHLLGEPIDILKKTKNLIPLYLKHYQHLWHYSNQHLAKILSITATNLNLWKQGHIMDKSRQDDLAKGLGITVQEVHDLMIPKLQTDEPLKLPHVSHTVKVLIQKNVNDIRMWISEINQDKLHIQEIKTQLKRQKEPHNSDNIMFVPLDIARQKLHKSKSALQRKMALFDAHSLQAYDLCKMTGNVKLEKMLHKIDIMVRYIHYDRHKMSIANKLAYEIIVACSPKAFQEQAKSDKYVMIAGIETRGIESVSYLVYGVKHTQFGNELKIHDLTIPGVANLDPYWRHLQREEIDAIYRDKFGLISTVNKTVEACTLSQADVRWIIKQLKQQGMSTSVTLLRANSVDWWLNHHSDEYRDTGDEEA